MKLKKVSELAVINPPHEQTIVDSLEVTFLPMKAVQELTGQIDTSESRKQAAVKKGYTPFRENDVLFAKITPCMENGKIAVARGLNNGFGYGSTEFYVFRCSEELRPKYLFYYLTQDIFRRDAKRNMSGAVGQLRVPKRYLEECIIPAPSVDEQDKIIAKIEELFSETDSADGLLTSATKLLKIYQQAVIDSVFDAIWSDDNLTTLNDVADIRGGVTKGRKLKDTEIIQLPYLRVANVQDGYLDLKQIKYIPGSVADLERYKLQYGDILFTEGGDKDKLGRGTIWRNQIEDCIHQNHIFRARVDLTKTDPEYVSFAAQTTRSRHYFFSKAKQTTNLASINMTQLKLLEIPNVSIDKQKEVVSKIQSMLSKVTNAHDSLILSSDFGHVLRQSILSKAFKGELI